MDIKYVNDQIERLEASQNRALDDMRVAEREASAAALAADRADARVKELATQLDGMFSRLDDLRAIGYALNDGRLGHVFK